MKANACKQTEFGTRASPGEPGSICPESVFLAWLLWLPPGREPRAAALDELARIDRQPLPLPAEAGRLRTMFAALLAADKANDASSSDKGSVTR